MLATMLWFGHIKLNYSGVMVPWPIMGALSGCISNQQYDIVSLEFLFQIISNSSSSIIKGHIVSSF